MNNTLTALEGVSAVHVTSEEALNGSTIVLFDDKFPAAVHIYGRAPVTFNTQQLDPANTDYYTDALFVAGGSRPGVAATAHTLTQALIEGRDLDNPAVSGAGIFDLSMLARQRFHADASHAFNNASSEPVPAGTLGAGRGASVGKFHYLSGGTEIGAMAGGVGNARIDRGEVIVYALSVVNALGNIVTSDERVLAGNRDETGGFRTFDGLSRFVTAQNTIISIVGTNVDLGARVNLANVARMATQGQIRATDPSGTSMDGDTVFVFSNRQLTEILNPVGQTFAEGDWLDVRTDLIGYMAAQAVRDSIYDAILKARSIPFESAYQGVIPSAQDYGHMGDTFSLR